MFYLTDTLLFLHTSWQIGKYVSLKSKIIIPVNIKVFPPLSFTVKIILRIFTCSVSIFILQSALVWLVLTWHPLSQLIEIWGPQRVLMHWAPHHVIWYSVQNFPAGPGISFMQQLSLRACYLPPPQNLLRWHPLSFQQRRKQTLMTFYQRAVTQV